MVRACSLGSGKYGKTNRVEKYGREGHQRLDSRLSSLCWEGGSQAVANCDERMAIEVDTSGHSSAPGVCGYVGEDRGGLGASISAHGSLDGALGVRVESAFIGSSHLHPV